MRENIEVSALGVGAGAAAARGSEPTSCSSVLGLAPFANTPAGSLAHGDERRLGVARALATEPRFVLLDEPAAGLPEAEVPAFAAVVRSVRDDHGAGVLLIDHNMALVMEICERIVVLDQGMTLAEGTPAEIRSNLGVAAAYLGEAPVREARRMSRSLVVESLDVRYGAGARRSRSVAAGRSGRDRRADRGQRRRQVVDAARDHGRRAGDGRRRPARRPSRCAAARPRMSRAAGSRSSRKGVACSVS